MFKKATRTGSRLRALIYGPSGSGKTYTALRIARGLGSKIAVIDSERGRASKYAGTNEGQFDFDVCELTRHAIEDYQNAMAAASDYDVLIIDSISHAWQSLLEEVDQKAAASRSNNKFNVWADATPKQRAFMGTILNHPAHVICTCRASTEWTQEKDERGKTKPVKVGLKPEQGKGIEYEFDVLGAIDPDHWMKVEKDNSRLYQDQIIEKPGEEVGRAWGAWLSDAPMPKPYREIFADEIAAALDSRGEGIDQAATQKKALAALLKQENMTDQTVTEQAGTRLIAAVRAGRFDIALPADKTETETANV